MQRLTHVIVTFLALAALTGAIPVNDLQAEQEKDALQDALGETSKLIKREEPLFKMEEAKAKMLVEKGRKKVIELIKKTRKALAESTSASDVGSDGLAAKDVKAARRARDSAVTLMKQLTEQTGDEELNAEKIQKSIRKLARKVKRYFTKKGIGKGSQATLKNAGNKVLDAAGTLVSAEKKSKTMADELVRMIEKTGKAVKCLLKKHKETLQQKKADGASEAKKKSEAKALFRTVGEEGEQEVEDHKMAIEAAKGTQKKLAHFMNIVTTKG